MLDKFRKFALVDEIHIPLYDPASPEDLVTGHTFVTGDVKISVNEGTFVNVDTLPTEIATASGIYNWDGDGTEDAFARVILRGVDQTGPKAWMDFVIDIETFGNAAAQYLNDLAAAFFEVDIRRIGTFNSDETFAKAATRFQQWSVDTAGFTPTNTEFEADKDHGEGVEGPSDDSYNTRTILWLGGVNENSRQVIRDYDQSSKRFTVSAMLAAPANNDPFIIE